MDNITQSYISAVKAAVSSNDADAINELDYQLSSGRYETPLSHFVGWCEQHSLIDATTATHALSLLDDLLPQCDYRSLAKPHIRVRHRCASRLTMAS